jgi:hypothetical protein
VNDYIKNQRRDRNTKTILMTKLWQSIIGVFICISCYGQNIQDTTIIYDYLPLYESKFLSLYRTERVKHSDKTFTDLGIFCQSDTSLFCKIHFKILNDSWFINNGGTWQVFFDPKRNRLLDVDLHSVGKKLISGKRIIVGNDTLYSFICEDVELNNPSFYTTYYFQPLYGIVIIKGNNGLLKRKDYANSSVKRELFY